MKDEGVRGRRRWKQTEDMALDQVKTQGDMRKLPGAGIVDGCDTMARLFWKRVSDFTRTRLRSARRTTASGTSIQLASDWGRTGQTWSAWV